MANNVGETTQSRDRCDSAISFLKSRIQKVDSLILENNRKDREIAKLKAKIKQLENEVSILKGSETDQIPYGSSSTKVLSNRVRRVSSTKSQEVSTKENKIVVSECSTIQNRLQNARKGLHRAPSENEMMSRILGVSSSIKTKNSTPVMKVAKHLDVKHSSTRIDSITPPSQTPTFKKPISKVRKDAAMCKETVQNIFSSSSCNVASIMANGVNVKRGDGYPQKSSKEFDSNTSKNETEFIQNVSHQSCDNSISPSEPSSRNSNIETSVGSNGNDGTSREIEVSSENEDVAQEEDVSTFDEKLGTHVSTEKTSNEIMAHDNMLLNDAQTTSLNQLEKEQHCVGKTRQKVLPSKDHLLWGSSDSSDNDSEVVDKKKKEVCENMDTSGVSVVIQHDESMDLSLSPSEGEDEDDEKNSEESDDSLVIVDTNNDVGDSKPSTKKRKRCNDDVTTATSDLTDDLFGEDGESSSLHSKKANVSKILDGKIEVAKKSIFEDNEQVQIRPTSPQSPPPSVVSRDVSRHSGRPSSPSYCPPAQVAETVSSNRGNAYETATDHQTTKKFVSIPPQKADSKVKDGSVSAYSENFNLLCHLLSVGQKRLTGQLNVLRQDSSKLMLLKKEGGDTSVDGNSGLASVWRKKVSSQLRRLFEECDNTETLDDIIHELTSFQNVTQNTRINESKLSIAIICDKIFHELMKIKAEDRMEVLSETQAHVTASIIKDAYNRPRINFIQMTLISLLLKLDEKYHSMAEGIIDNHADTMKFMTKQTPSNFMVSYLRYTILKGANFHTSNRHQCVTIVQFFLTLLRTKGLMLDARSFIYDVLFFKMTRLHVIICVGFEIWPQIFHPTFSFNVSKQHGHSRSSLIWKAIVWVVFNSGLSNSTDMLVFRARNLLFHFVLKREEEKADVDEQFYKLNSVLFTHDVLDVVAVTTNPSIEAEVAFSVLLVSRWQDSGWCDTHIISRLLDNLQSTDDRMSWVIQTAGLVCRSYGVEGRSRMMQLFNPIKDILRSPDLKDDHLQNVALVSLCRICHHSQVQLCQFFYSFIPKFPLTIRKSNNTRFRDVIADFIGTRANRFAHITVTKMKKGGGGVDDRNKKRSKDRNVGYGNKILRTGVVKKD